jgi:RNA polymerase sigma factor (sigma-70 family)
MSRPVQNADAATFDTLLGLLCTAKLTQEAQRDVTAALLETPGGPFIDSNLPMRRSVLNLARKVTADVLRNKKLPSDCISPEDVAQEAMTVFITRGHTIQNRKSIVAWFWSVMRVTLAKELKKNRPLIESTDLKVLDVKPRGQLTGKAENLGAAQSRRKAENVRAAVKTLSPALRRVVILHGLLGESHEETARRLGIDSGTVRVRWHRAKRELQHKLVETLN